MSEVHVSNGVIEIDGTKGMDEPLSFLLKMTPFLIPLL